MARTPRIPAYRRHSSGQARVTFDGKDHLLGPYGSAASREAYERAVAEWLARPPAVRDNVGQTALLTLNGLVLRYWRHCGEYYRFAADQRRGDRYCLKSALRVVRSLYGRTRAEEFGPLALKACRAKMVELGWSRTYINSQVDRVRRMFRWAAEEELLPASVHQNLRVVSGLRFGRTDARETARIRPVPEPHLAAALPFLPPTVGAMVRFQLLTGCRPAEVCAIRPMDIERSDPACWVYRPGSDHGDYGDHKTAHHGHERLILVGPRAQAALNPYLGVAPDQYCFSPAASEARRNACRRAERCSPMTPSQAARRPTGRRRRRPGQRYDTHSYRRAIARACQSADEAAHRADPTIPEDQVLVPVWAPNRLRHNRATELRPYGLDVTKTILGHAKVETTEVYAEKDVRAAMQLIARVG